MHHFISSLYLNLLCARFLCVCVCSVNPCTCSPTVKATRKGAKLMQKRSQLPQTVVSGKLRRTSKLVGRAVRSAEPVRAKNKLFSAFEGAATAPIYPRPPLECSKRRRQRKILKSFGLPATSTAPLGDACETKALLKRLWAGLRLPLLSPGSSLRLPSATVPT